MISPDELSVLREEWVARGLPAGGVCYLSPKTVANDYLAEFQAHIAASLQIPADNVQIRVTIETDKIVPDVNIIVPRAWLHGKDLRTRQEVDLMFRQQIQAVVRYWSEWYVNVVRVSVSTLWATKAKAATAATNG